MTHCGNHHCSIRNDPKCYFLSREMSVCRPRRRQDMRTVVLLIMALIVSTTCGEQQHSNEVIVDTMGDITVPSGEHRATNAFTSADLKCRIWLAPSTLQGAGLGMFAGTDFQPEEEFLHGGDITVAITDITQHNSAPGQSPYGSFLWDEYTWSATGLKMDSIGHEQNIASEGFGSAANSFLPVYNVDEWAPRITHTNALHRSRDPGVGAYTQYHHRLSTSRRFIEAGEELYVSCKYNFLSFVLDTLVLLSSLPLFALLTHMHVHFTYL